MNWYKKAYISDILKERRSDRDDPVVDDGLGHLVNVRQAVNSLSYELGVDPAAMGFEQLKSTMVENDLIPKGIDQDRFTAQVASWLTQGMQQYPSGRSYDYYEDYMRHG